MTLQALKAAEFESSSLRVVPVEVQRVVSLSQLPLLSYGFQKGELPPEKLFFDVIAKTDSARINSPNIFRVIAKQFVNGCSGLGIRLVGHDVRYWDTPQQYLAQTMQNMFYCKLRADSELQRVDGAAIHGQGAIFVPLAQGAHFRINQPDYEGAYSNHWDVIVTGEINFFGEVRPFTINHAHCQGFALPEIDKTMEEAIAGLFKWFPFLDGHVAVINRQYVTNPVTHQDRL